MVARRGRNSRPERARTMSEFVDRLEDENKDLGTQTGFDKLLFEKRLMEKIDRLVDLAIKRLERDGGE